MKQPFSAKNRRDLLHKLASEPLDVLVIGGGITGAGIALDARTRGMNIGLVEMQDFAAGTSSRSTKLIHGGLRYLKQFHVKMVAEVGRERAIVYENGPHVTQPEWMLLPFYRGGTFGPFMTSFGLMLYDHLAGVKHTERRVILRREDVLERVPILKKDGLLGGGYYVEYRTDDARLTIEVLKKAVAEEAIAVNYAQVQSFIYEHGKVVGVTVYDRLHGDTYSIYARRIVNATGPWVDSIRSLDKSLQGKTLRLTKGVHLVFRQERFPLRQAIYFDTEDGRMIFAIPRDGKTYVGTTDTDYNEDISHPRVTESDRNYLLAAVNGMFPKLCLTEQDIESSWAGLRPLIHEEGKPPSEVSRKDEIFISSSGLISIAGGKLTGYRKMAETITDVLARELSRDGFGPFKRCATRKMPISGGDFGGSSNYERFVIHWTEEGKKLGLSEDVARMLSARYGTNVEHIYRHIQTIQQNDTIRRLPVEIQALLQYSIEAEMVAKPVDFFIRRTGALYFHIDWLLQWKDEVLQVMAELLQYSEEQSVAYTMELEQEILHSTRGNIEANPSP